MTDLVEKMAGAMCDANVPDDVRPTQEPWIIRSKAALRAIKDAGYDVVPVEPSEQQLYKAHRTAQPTDLNIIRSVYAAMLAAAPDITGDEK